MRRISLIPLLAIALMGAGCNSNKQPETPTTKSPQQPGTIDQVTTVSPEAYEYVDPETTYAKQALLNLATANSFHSRMVIPGINEDVTADLVFVKNQGMRGTLAIPSDQGTTISEVYLTEAEVLFKQGTNPWQNISGTDEAKELATSLKGSFSFDEEEDFILNGSEQYLGKSSGSNCTIYRFRQVTTEGRLQPFSVCITNQDLPTYVEIDTLSERPIRIEYSDVNTVGSIERPQL
ncbi:MAG: hypothetical protein KC582_04235 [Candidatus Magasanikbacteria bacterium]|nr:hypothetical protein [Candidatus Magasanikbacteria bacterium]MCA9389373.1 hypothetical protein [Candidatus Magasanikbacteria bacterium]MCA9391435.1 hypothetical protein [Candidatus Magasanikbacteria bacterium]USN52540.1 MAG: hypothetical protein H6759_00445 [Candidatus Nomurabacteria bacterium]HPF95229.1 hypothetical protein [bacterium]